MLAPIVRASTSVWTFATWWSPMASWMRIVCAGVFGNGSVVMWCAEPLIFSLVQMLWDRGEPSGSAHHMTTDPLPNTPAHTILIHEAIGDHQVANVQTEVEARTIGASIYQPALTVGRSTDVTPFFAIPAIPSFPFDGSALVVWDHGCSTPASCPNPPAVADCTCPPPTTNTPPPGGHD